MVVGGGGAAPPPPAPLCPESLDRPGQVIGCVPVIELYPVGLIGHLGPHHETALGHGAFPPVDPKLIPQGTSFRSGRQCGSATRRGFGPGTMSGSIAMASALCRLARVAFFS